MYKSNSADGFQDQGDESMVKGNFSLNDGPDDSADEEKVKEFNAKERPNSSKR
jgi:hypothetical protein